MIAADTTAFTEAFNGLRAIFPLRADKAELAHIIRLYFRALEGFSIDQVEAGATAWQADGTKFPKPKEWKAAIPRDAAARLSALDDSEAAEHRRAIALHYEDEPCHCFACHQAEVTHRMLRYVPLLDTDGRDARGTLDGRPVTRGYWAHGEELRRFYEARDAFRGLSARFTPRSMPKPKTAEPRSPATQALVELGHEMQAAIARCDDAERDAAAVSAEPEPTAEETRA